MEQRLTMVVRKYSTMENGEQFVMIIGIIQKQRSSVVSLDLKEQLQDFALLLLEKAQEVYGWTTLTVPDKRLKYLSAYTGDGE